MVCLITVEFSSKLVLSKEHRTTIYLRTKQCLLSNGQFLSLSSYKSNSKRLSIFILIVRNRYFDVKVAPKSFSKWLSKYSHHLFRISRQPKIDRENGSLECKQDIKKLLESEDVQRAVFMQMTLQLMIQRVKFRKTFGDARSFFQVVMLGHHGMM